VPRRPWWLHPLTLLWIGCWAGLFVITHVPVPKGVPVARGMDKVIHLVAYFALATLGGRAAVSRGVHVTPRWIVTWTVVYAVYAVLDEALQGLSLVNRSASLTDWLADVAGLLLAAALLWMYPNPTRGNATEVEEDEELFRL
jgi:VanZ family protein